MLAALGATNERELRRERVGVALERVEEHAQTSGVGAHVRERDRQRRLVGAREGGAAVVMTRDPRNERVGDAPLDVAEEVAGHEAHAACEVARPVLARRRMRVVETHDVRARVVALRVAGAAAVAVAQVARAELDVVVAGHVHATAHARAGLDDAHQRALVEGVHPARDAVLRPHGGLEGAVRHLDVGAHQVVLHERRIVEERLQRTVEIVGAPHDPPAREGHDAVEVAVGVVALEVDDDLGGHALDEALPLVGARRRSRAQRGAVLVDVGRHLDDAAHRALVAARVRELLRVTVAVRDDKVILVRLALGRRGRRALGREAGAAAWRGHLGVSECADVLHTDQLPNMRVRCHATSSKKATPGTSVSLRCASSSVSSHGSR